MNQNDSPIFGILNYCKELGTLDKCVRMIKIWLLSN